MIQVIHHPGAYPGSCSMKGLGVFLRHTRWNASTFEGYSQHEQWYPFIHVCLGGESLARKCNTMWLARTLTQTALSRDKSTNHEATMPTK